MPEAGEEEGVEEPVDVEELLPPPPEVPVEVEELPEPEPVDAAAGPPLTPVLLLLAPTCSSARAADPSPMRSAAAANSLRALLDTGACTSGVSTAPEVSMDSKSYGVPLAALAQPEASAAHSRFEHSNGVAPAHPLNFGQR